EKDEQQHLSEEVPGDHAAIDHGPGIEKRRFDVEEDEQHRDLIEADVDAFAVLVEERDAALIRRELGRVPLVPSEDPVQAEKDRAEDGGDEEQNQNREVAVSHETARILSSQKRKGKRQKVKVAPPSCR